MPNSIEIIGGNAFYNCPSIKEIKIGRKIKEIGTVALGITYDPNKGMKVVDGFKMYCYKETVAEKYAKDLTINYTLIQNSEPKSTRLAGVPLATKLNAPILLTAKDTLPDVTLAEINRLGAKNVIILGGTSAISEKVEKTLKTNKLKTERIAGKTRFGTATAIAEKLNQKPTDVFFVYGLNYADALSVGGIAAAKNAPIIYLTTKGELNADTAAYLAKIKGSVKNAYVIGGTGVISNDMASKAAKALGLSKAARVAGSTRFLTCVEVNKKFSDVLTGDKICVATGMDSQDALAGGVYAAAKKQALFLADGKKLQDVQNSYLKSKNAGKITVFGGTGAVPDSLVKLIAQASV